MTKQHKERLQKFVLYIDMGKHVLQFFYQLIWFILASYILYLVIKFEPGLYLKEKCNGRSDNHISFGT